MAGDINRVTLVGRLTRDPELRHLPSGSPYIQLGVACNGRQKDEAGNWTDKPNFFDVKVFGNQAEMLSSIWRRAGASASTGGSTGHPGRHRTGRSARRSRSSPSRCSSSTAAATAARASPTSAVGRQRRPHGLRPRRSGGEHRRRHPLLRPGATRNRMAQREKQSGARRRPSQSTGPLRRKSCYFQGEDRRGRLQGLQPAAPLCAEKGRSARGRITGACRRHEEQMRSWSTRA